MSRPPLIHPPIRSWSPLGRPTCLSCFRPFSHCLCESITPTTAHTNILILQHPHERRKYYSTSRLVTRAIANSRLERGILFDEASLRARHPDQQLYLLYPSSEAVDCASLPLDRRSTVIVIDGTWVEARKVMHRNPFLRTLPALTFQAPIRSNYRIRKQPEEHCLSTLESIAWLLTLSARTEAEREVPAALLRAFDQMVSQQLKAWPRRAA